MPAMLSASKHCALTRLLWLVKLPINGGLMQACDAVDPLHMFNLRICLFLQCSGESALH